MYFFFQSTIEFKFVVSYDMDDETVTEIGSFKELSLNQHSSWMISLCIIFEPTLIPTPYSLFDLKAISPSKLMLDAWKLLKLYWWILKHRIS